MIRKIKNWLGIEGVKVKIELDEAFDYQGKTVSGKVILTSKTEQFIQSLNFQLIEKYTRGRRSGKLIDEYVLGRGAVRVYKLIQPDKALTIPFSLSFEDQPSPMDEFGNKNMVYKGISSIAKLLKNAKSDYVLLCEAEVEGNALKPYEKLALN